MLADTFPVASARPGFSLYGLAVIVAPTIGPTLGGWLTDHLSWHWIFLINGPIGVIALILVQWLRAGAGNPRAGASGPPGPRGSRWTGSGFCSWRRALAVSKSCSTKASRTTGSLQALSPLSPIISLVSLLLLLPWELTREEPIVDLRLFAYRQFATCAALMFTAGAVLFSSTQLLPQLVQTNFQYTATLSGLALMPGGVAMALDDAGRGPPVEPGGAEIYHRLRTDAWSRCRCGI